MPSAVNIDSHAPSVHKATPAPQLLLPSRAGGPCTCRDDTNANTTTMTKTYVGAPTHKRVVLASTQRRGQLGRGSPRRRHFVEGQRARIPRRRLRTQPWAPLCGRAGQCQANNCNGWASNTWHVRRSCGSKTCSRLPATLRWQQSEPPSLARRATRHATNQVPNTCRHDVDVWPYDAVARFVG